jgi:sugar lactone lactonase YvrE
MDQLTAALVVDSRCTLGEGLLWDPRRDALLWTDIERSALWLHHTDDGSTRTWRLPARLGSFALCDSGKLLLALAKGLYLADVDRPADDGILPVTRLVALEENLPSTRTNDGRTDRAGNFVFGTLNEDPERAPIGSFYQYSMGSGLRRLELGGVAIPNSICFSPDGSTMYYCDSVRGRIFQCRYDAASAGVSDVRPFVEVGAGGGLPDGSIVDADGCVWNAAWGAGMVRRYSPAGAADREVVVPAKNPTCPAFGGRDLATLYVTSARQEMTPEELAATPEAGGVYGTELAGVRGLAEPRFRDR